MFNFSANLDIPYIYRTQFPVEFPLFWSINISANVDMSYINNVHNFPLNFQSSKNSIFLQIQTVRTYNVQNFPLNFRSSRHSIFLQNQRCRTYIMYIISRWIFGVLDIQFFLQIQTFRTYIMYRISRWIYAILDINFSANSNIPYIWCTQFPVEFAQFRTVNFSANPNNLYKYNVHNFLSNLCSFGCSIFLQIHTFRTYIMYTISEWIFGVLDIQFFLLIQTFRTYIMYTISCWISAFWTFNFSTNPDITYI